LRPVYGRGTQGAGVDAQAAGFAQFGMNLRAGYDLIAQPDVFYNKPWQADAQIEVPNHQLFPIIPQQLDIL